MASILVVDDDLALSEMISIMLRSEGFDTVLAVDGPAALAQLEAGGPDLVLLDVMLPGLSGVDVCQKIREISGIPIIMLTAKSDSADVVRGLESGADDYVVKPFNP
ncbi:MAG: response regulator, partial [Pontimonas sp.]